MTLKGRFLRVAVAIVLGGTAGIATTARTAQAAPVSPDSIFCIGNHGCWFTPPNPPACDLCGDPCNPGQCCCVIL